MMDLNDFKGVNDTHGHAMGDRVLIRVADHLRTAFRSDDIVCRSGGDEFLAYLIGSTGEGAVERAQTLVDLMRDDSELHIGEYRVRMSIGVAVGSFHSSDGGAEISDPLVTMADQAMYQSKRLKGFAEETPIMLAKETVLSPTVFSGLTD
jgi:diguanylate cyclase (GGDEF)-like protein